MYVRLDVVDDDLVGGTTGGGQFLGEDPSVGSVGW